ncbi:MAG TPA: TonB-dependent receptor, partial [Steroidobacteraceae bacterium]|nr:TonB-dependent receptor [Steroidobacteraceae bacterium]
AADTSEEKAPEVIVTGSRIAAPNLESTSPVQVVTSNDIRITGKTDISDIINQLPQNFNNDLGQDLGNRTSGLTTAGGVATADLRGLGPNRTLVLVNGRRLGQGSPFTFIASPGADLDQIPALLVDRVDVMTGGASAVYGSDAIAGVINFVMKKNFVGFEIEGQLGENYHDNHNSYAQSRAAAAGLTPLTGTSQDGRNKTLQILFGTNFADGNGNITGYMSYLHADPVRSGDRDYGFCQLAANATLTGADCQGSSNSNFFRPRTGPNANTTYSVSGTSFVPRGSVVTNPPASYNSQPFIYLSRQDDRYQAGFLAHYDINDYAKPYAEFMFMNDRTHQEIAPTALFRSSNPNNSTLNYDINCSNPLLSAQQQAILCTPAQIAADGLNPGSVIANVEIGRRNVEGGQRFSDYEHTNMRGVVGVTGDFARAFTYDVYAQYYYVSFYNVNRKYFNYANIDQALLVTGTRANPVCISGPPCVPYNIFSDNGVTPAQTAYLSLDGTGFGTSTQRTIHADVSVKLGEYGVKLPTAIDDVRANIGLEHRNENQAFAPDSAELSGQLAGFGSAATALDNSISVDEQFIEVRAPLVQNKSGVQDLIFDTGYRRSDYSTSGTVNTYKFEVQYAPIEGLRLRGSFNHAIRAAKIVELYNPQLVGLIQLGNDPCAPTVNASNQVVPAARSLAECLRSVAPAQAAAFTDAYGNGGTTNTIPQAVLGQLSQLTGGNTNLQPETADTYTVGLIVTPSLLPHFTGSIDYYHINLKNLVGVLPANIIVNNCIAGGDPFYCRNLVRQTNTFSLTGATIAGGGYINQTSINVGAGVLDGIDLQAAYKWDLPKWGSLTFAMNGAYMLKNVTSPAPGLPSYDCTGLFGSTCQTINPVWHHNFRTVWTMPSDVSLALTWRYLDAVKLDNNDPDPSLHFSAFGAYNAFDRRLPSFSYFDLAAAWKINEGFELRAGINNLLDKDPPLATFEITSGGAANTYSTYDALGRQLFLAFTAKF